MDALSRAARKTSGSELCGLRGLCGLCDLPERARPIVVTFDHAQRPALRASQAASAHHLSALPLAALLSFAALPLSSSPSSLAALPLSSDLSAVGFAAVSG